MKRTILSAALCAVLLSLLCVGAAGAKLSPAMDHLAAQAELVKSGETGEEMHFCDADFRQALGVTSYPSVTVVSLPDPSLGILKLGGVRVSAGQTIPRAEISRLSFSPATPLVTDASFTFQAGNLCGAADLTCTLKFTEKKNSAPTCVGGAEACFSVHTRKNITVFGTLSGYDPDGDELTYLVITYPKRGALTVTEPRSGEFRYTPRAGFTGEDQFTYVVRDSYGSYSPIATVRIRVEKGVADLDFDDVSPSLAEDAARYLVARGILSYRQSENGAVFSPEQGMTRAEFVCAAMKATGHFFCDDTETIFDDNGDIPLLARGYVASAQQAGYLEGEWVDGGLCFRPQDKITAGEAAGILSRMLPESAAAAIATGTGTSELTRAQAAVMLYTAAVAP